jgi:hypothetical protein
MKTLKLHFASDPDKPIWIIFGTGMFFCSSERVTSAPFSANALVSVVSYDGDPLFVIESPEQIAEMLGVTE